jgi:hypothetical protein
VSFLSGSPLQRAAESESYRHIFKKNEVFPCKRSLRKSGFFFFTRKFTPL